MGLRGTKPRGNNIELRTTISRELDDGLNTLVALLGVSKASLVRQALREYLTTLEVARLEADETIAPTKTAGRTRSTTANFT